MTADENSEWEASAIITSGDHTWLETGSLEGEVGFDEDSEIQGPINVGLALSTRS
ncbi:MAG: hypothetical protein U5P41_02145 [Gammaproteobacteria bacterium]|nr:hypothetical protein [Gammaproteobacteria bacterium]